MQITSILAKIDHMIFSSESNPRCQFEGSLVWVIIRVLTSKVVSYDPANWPISRNWWHVSS